MNINGTTFSGLSTRTTLGNTLRSILYVFHYLREALICEEPWNNKDLFVIASGDDTVVFSKPYLSDRIHDAIYENTTRTTDPQVVGLG